MHKDCVFTIVAKNYIGLGEILGKSLHKYNPEVDFKIFVADEFRVKPDILPAEVVIAKEILKWDECRYRDMSFKYNLTEFCTAIKPGCGLYLLSQGYEKVIYLDPDIFIYSSISPILESLDSHEMCLTPQVLGIHKEYTGEHPEWHMNVNGIFNLGFFGIRNTPNMKKLLEWWDIRLIDSCFSERTLGQFTDQKWMDWAHGFLGDGRVTTLCNLGINMAPWNFFERKIVKDGDVFFVEFRTDENKGRDRLIFIHFSGYDYRKMKNGEVYHNRMNLNDYPDLADVMGLYRDAIVEDADLFDSFITEEYSYSKYENGDMIEPFHRRLYHGLPIDIRINTNPFNCGEGTFHNQLRKKSLIDTSLQMMNISSLKKGDLSNKRRIIERLFKLIFNIGGYKRYAPFLKSLYEYCRPEMHTFLIEKENIKK